ncbi:MAG: pirin family protein, partial [Bacteroidota bacterium]
TLNPENKCVFLFSIEGQIKINDNSLPERDALGIWDTAELAIHCETEAHFLLIETPVNQK